MSTDLPSDDRLSVGFPISRLMTRCPSVSRFAGRRSAARRLRRPAPSSKRYSASVHEC